MLRLLDKGWASEQIAHELGISSRQVAAIKAHKTMRSYDVMRQPEQDKQLAESIEERPPAKIEKNVTNDVSVLLDRLKIGLSRVAVLVGREVATGGEVYWDPNPDSGSANPHLMIMGESGFGKTYTIQCLITELARRAIPSVIIDYGRGFDLRGAPAEFIHHARPTEILAGEYGLSINPLKIHPGDVNGPINVAVRVSDSFSRVYRIGVQQHSLLQETILEVFEEKGISKSDKSSWTKGPPYLSDVFKKLELIAGDRRHRGTKIALSLKSHISSFFIFDTFRPSGQSMDWSSIVADKHKAFILQLRGLEGRTQQVITEFLLWDLYHYMVHSGLTPLRLYCVLDEAHKLSSETDSPVEALIREARKFGVGLIFASQQPKDFSDAIYSNTASKLIFQTQDINKRVITNLIHKSESVYDPKLLTLTIGKLPRGRAYFMTQNFGFIVNITNFSGRTGSWDIIDSDATGTSVGRDMRG